MVLNFISLIWKSEPEQNNILVLSNWKGKTRNAETQMHVLTCTHAPCLAYVRTHTQKHTKTQNTSQPCPTGWAQIFRYSEAHPRESQRWKGAPTEEYLSEKICRKDRRERVRKLIIAQEIIYFQIGSKGLKGVFRRVQFIRFSTMTASVELPWSILQLCVINLPPCSCIPHLPDIQAAL